MLFTFAVWYFNLNITFEIFEAPWSFLSFISFFLLSPHAKFEVESLLEDTQHIFFYITSWKKCPCAYLISSMLSARSNYKLNAYAYDIVQNLSVLIEY
jgi:hypothetical protein